MIKATISNEPKRNIFAKAGAKKIAGGMCFSKPSVRGLVLNKYKLIGSGTCELKQTQRDNVVLFTKQKEVA